MADSIGATIQTLTDGRLTLKEAHLKYLGLDMEADDPKVDISYGQDRCILLHNPEKRAALVDEIMAGVSIIPDDEEGEVGTRLEDVALSVSVDKQGRLRIPELFLKFGEMMEKTSKVCILPRQRIGWLEIRTEANFEAFIADPNDRWYKLLGRVVRRARGEQSESSAA